MKLTFSRSVSETIIFDTNRATVESNFNCVADFVRRMDAESDPRPRTQSRDSGPSSLVWTGIAGDAVADFLDEFITHRQATKAQSKVMAQYIRGRLRATEPELTSWTVCLLSNPGPVLDLAGHPVGRTGRARFPNNPPFEPGLYGIRRLLSPADEWLDLTPDELAEAKRLTLEMWEKGFVKSKSGEPPVGPNGLAVREARPAARGLVLLYALDERAALPAELTVPFMGLGVSFPASKDPAAGSIEYVVNSVYSQVELELE